MRALILTVRLSMRSARGVSVIISVMSGGTRRWRQGRPVLSRGRLLATLAGLLIALASAYAALAVYKALDYTANPARPARSTATPADLGLVYEEVSFESAADDRLRLSGWWIPNRDARRVAILVHGRHQDKLALLALARPLWDHGFHVLLIDLRGHGDSDRAPASYGIMERQDILGAVAFAQRQGVEQVGVVGWSLGGASALLAAERSSEIDAVVSDSSWADSEPLLARNALRPGLRLALRLVRGVDLAQSRPERAIENLGGRPVLIIHGERDQAIPVEHGHRLAAAGDGVEAWIVPDAGHLQAISVAPDAYVRRVVTFLDRATSDQSRDGHMPTSRRES